MINLRNTPFETLGVPPYVVEEAVNTEDTDQLLRIAEKNFRTLSAEFHPDKGGASEVFAKLADAMEQLRDPAGLAFFLDDLDDEGYRTERSNKHRAARVASNEQKLLAFLASELSLIDQTAILPNPVLCFNATGIEGTVIASFSARSSQDMQLDWYVVDDSSFIASSFSRDPGGKLVVRGTTVEGKTTSRTCKKPHRTESATLIGWVPGNVVDQQEARQFGSAASDRMAIETAPDARSITKPSYSELSDAWFGAHLSAHMQDGSHPVIYSRGQVAMLDVQAVASK